MTMKCKKFFIIFYFSYKYFSVYSGSSSPAEYSYFASIKVDLTALTITNYDCVNCAKFLIFFAAEDFTMTGATFTNINMPADPTTEYYSSE